MNVPREVEAPSKAAAPSASKRAHPYRAFAMRAGLGGAVIAFLLWHYDARPVLRILPRENPAWFGGAVLLFVAGQVMSAWRWQLLAAVLHLHERFASYLRFYFIGMFTNLFVPGLIGGDAARAIYLGRKSAKMGEAVASVVADRGIGLLALFWLAAAMAMIERGALAPGVIRPVIAVGAIALAGFLAAPLVARIVHLMPRPIRRAGGIVMPYLHRPATMLPAAGLSLILQISLAICQWMLARGLGLATPVAIFMLCVPIANVFASLPLTLNGLGIRETAYLMLFGMAGVRHDDAIALGLLWFLATMLGGLTGAIAFVTTPAPVVIEQQS
ncbi:MAG TPA: lysylphosphatidylglycerol synthase transmembrane domain-containing protein [Candidatus Binataceae bacterium]|nr:lysylphosphatidylglycerol synthase transmembrane domain-containing protein [Candidatus Binataceae bacterium]